MVERRDTRAGRVFDLVIQALIVLSLVTFSLETVPRMALRHGDALTAAEAIFIAIFTVEYLLRLAVADRLFKFAFSFYGLVDLLAILPFYLTVGLDLRGVRVLRILRIFRTLKLLRYAEAARRLHRALKLAKEELVLFLVTAILVLYIAAVGIYYFERNAQPDRFGSIIESLWWAVTSLTTVGYGDAYPVTLGGKLFTFVVLIVGLGVVAVPTGIFASALSRARSAPEEDDESVRGGE
jgi:voltage-gated potassium channel